MKKCDKCEAKCDECRIAEKHQKNYEEWVNRMIRFGGLIYQIGKEREEIKEGDEGRDTLSSIQGGYNNRVKEVEEEKEEEGE